VLRTCWRKPTIRPCWAQDMRSITPDRQGAALVREGGPFGSRTPRNASFRCRINLRPAREHHASICGTGDIVTIMACGFRAQAEETDMIRPRSATV